METQVASIDQPFHSAYEKFMEITSHLSTEMSCDPTHREPSPVASSSVPRRSAPSNQATVIASSL